MDYNKHVGRRGTSDSRALRNQPTNIAAVLSSEEEISTDVDEPPLESTRRPFGVKLRELSVSSFAKTKPALPERKESLLSSALHLKPHPATSEPIDTTRPHRGMSNASTWSNNSVSTAELTSDGGLTSPGTRTSTPSPPLPATVFNSMAPVFNKKPFEQPVSVVRHDDEDHVGPLQAAPVTNSGEPSVEATLGRKRCISFACGKKASTETVVEAKKPAPAPAPEQTAEPPKRACTIKFACPPQVSSNASSQIHKPYPARAASPAPAVYRSRAPPRSSPKPHRDSDSTVRNTSPVSVRKPPPAKDRTRRLSANSDLARCEAFRFHEFASSEEEIEEWTQESTCHRSRLTITDTLKIENSLRQLGEEAEEEAMEDEEEELNEDDDDVEVDDDEQDDDAEGDISSDEGFQTDDEEGFAGSDDDVSDAESDFNWWAPGAYSTAATSVEHLENMSIIRPSSRRSISESSIGSDDGQPRFQMPQGPARRKKSRPVNIRVPSPELPDSTDFVCGTLDEDRPLEAAYMSCLERRRAAKHKVTPQDIDPTFPTSDPEMEEDDDVDEPDHACSESDHHLMLHGQMEPLDGDVRGRSKNAAKKRSPAQSPKRLRSPPPAKRGVHRSPPPRKAYGTSPKRQRSPAPCLFTRRSSAASMSQRPGLSIRFSALASRPSLTTSASLPRTPTMAYPPDDAEDEDTCRELPVRRAAIDIKVGLENKRQRRREQLLKKMQRKGGKDKRPAPGKGCERMREVGVGLAAHRGKTAGFVLGMPPALDGEGMHVLSV